MKISPLLYTCFRIEVRGLQSDIRNIIRLCCEHARFGLQLGLPQVLEYSLLSISGCNFHFRLQFFWQSVDELLEFMETWDIAISFATCKPAVQ